MATLRILVAPSGFKESLTPEEAADCIETGLSRVVDASSVIHKIPLHDGGEGFCKALVATHGGEIKHMKVKGPIGQEIESHYGMLPDKTAVLDMASAAGLRLVPADNRNPTKTTSYGVGQLIAAALDAGAEKVIVGCGDSGTSDGGVGMLQALGYEFYDDNGEKLPIAAGGGSLSSLATIKTENIHHSLQPNNAVKIEAVCNVKNLLCGPKGVSRIYGPQKGATPSQITLLSTSMDRLALAARPLLPSTLDIASAPGAGASGGLGAGLLIAGATLRPRSQAIDDYFRLDRVLSQPWDVVFTAEGSLDAQSAQGKMTVEVARRAARRGAQVVALTGTICEGAESVYEEGIAAFASILDGPCSLGDAMGKGAEMLTDAAERAMRMLQVGLSIREAKREMEGLEVKKGLSLQVVKPVVEETKEKVMGMTAPQTIAVGSTA